MLINILAGVKPLKKIVFTSSLTLLALASPAYGVDDDEYFENPGLSAYMAEKTELPPPPKIEFPFPEGLYIGVVAGGGKINSVDIKNRTENIEFRRTNQSKTKVIGQGGASLGYLFRESGWFNQIEIQYMNRGNFVYKGVGPFGTLLILPLKIKRAWQKYTLPKYRSLYFPIRICWSGRF